MLASFLSRILYIIRDIFSIGFALFTRSISQKQSFNQILKTETESKAINHLSRILYIIRDVLRTRQADPLIHRAHALFAVAGDHKASVSDNNRDRIFRKKARIAVER